jgi:predicted secreted protein
MKTWSLFLPALAALLLMSGGPAPAVGASNPGATAQLNADNNNQTVAVGQGAVLTLSLPSNPTTGYIWNYAGEPDQSVLVETSHFSINPSRAIGSGGNEHWVFRAVGTGDTKLNLAYARPWENASPAKTYSVEIGVDSSPIPPSQLNHVSFTIGSSAYSVNGQVYQMEDPAFLQDGRVYVPVRYLASAVGLSATDMYWDAASSSVVLPPDQNGIVYRLKIGDNNIYQLGTGEKDSVVQTMDATPLDKDGHAYLPARFIVGLYGYEAGWDAVGRSLSIDPVHK